MSTDMAIPGRSPSTGVRGSRRLRRAGAGWLLAASIVLTVAAGTTLMSTALAVGMRLDDRQIDGHFATATATVLSVSALRTGVEFVDSTGITVRPPGGVLYPGLLSIGQRFQVEYSTLDPAVVRVAGRTAAVGNVSLVLTLTLTWMIAVPLNWLLRRRARKKRTTRLLPSPELPVSGA